MEQFVIPKTFKAAQLVEFGKEFQIAETPQLKEGEVLIKVEAAPVNPSDLLLKTGQYPANKVLPAILGIEGSGIIVQLGPNVENVKVGIFKIQIFFKFNENNNQRQKFNEKQKQIFKLNIKIAIKQYKSCLHCQLNLWYLWIVLSYQVIPLDDDISFEVGASSIVNPITVMVMLVEPQEQGAKAVVHTAAASALGRMLVRYFQDSGIDVINIVRRQEQVELLQKEGAKYVLNQTSETFFKDLNALATQLNATVFLDAVGGSLTGQILTQLPNKSTAYVYGLLSGQPISDVTANDLLFRSKTVKGFWLNTSIQKFNPFGDINAQKKLNELLKKTLRTEYSNQYSLNQINEGIEFYQANQTSGKILIRPNQ